METLKNNTTRLQAILAKVQALGQSGAVLGQAKLGELKLEKGA